MALRSDGPRGRPVLMLFAALLTPMGLPAEDAPRCALDDDASTDELVGRSAARTDARLDASPPGGDVAAALAARSPVPARPGAHTVHLTLSRACPSPRREIPLTRAPKTGPPRLG